MAGAYGLVFTILACVGISAGQILYVGDRAISAGAAGIIGRCALKFPVSAVALENVPDFSRCASPAYRSQGFFVLGAALVVVVAAAALAVIVPRAELRPLRREEKRLRVMPQVITRFGSWCNAVGLSGQRQAPAGSFRAGGE